MRPGIGKIKKYDIIIGIDPDVDKNGMATIDVNKKTILCAEALTFPNTLAYFMAQRNACRTEALTLLVVVEAGWLNKGNWHVSNRTSGYKAAAVGNAAGRNHEVGRKLIEMCRHYGIDVAEQKPFLKCWKGTDRKITADEIKQITGFDKRCNQEVRDAILIAWNSAGLPIKIKGGV